MFGAGRDKKKFVLRTSKNDIGLLRAKHKVGLSGIKPTHIAPPKWAARIERDYWVFGIDITQVPDIVAAVNL